MFFIVAPHCKKRMKLTEKDNYVLICDDSKWAKGQKANKLICGVFGSRAEAKEVQETIKDCGCKHYIKKCKVTVEF